MAKEKVYHAYTTTYPGISNRLINQVQLFSDGNSCIANAQWDTGATGTAIADEVAKELNLVATGKTYITTPAGAKTVNTYMVDIVFPNNVTIKDVQVFGTEIGNQGIQVLIGMDIITLGDLAVSNYDGNTMFSFRLPSKQPTDYVKQIQFENKIGPRHGKGKRKKKK